MIKLALSDVDGTLVPFGHQHVSLRTLEAIRTLKDAGIHFGLATGRDEPDLIRQFCGHSWPFDTGILSNGKKIMVDGEIACLTLIDNDAVARVASLALEYPESFVSVYPLDAVPSDRVYCIGATKEQIAPWLMSVGADAVLTERMPDVQILGATIACNHSQQMMEELIARAERECPELDFAQPFPQWCDILPKGLNKGSALPILLKALGITTDEMVFFGDAENDLALLGAVENSVAVANAAPAAAAAARWHIGACEDDAVALALEQIAQSTRDGVTPTFMRS
ncbi:MAG: HAD family phosphatase [Atopobiaceae bacterium]|nr:HAD family phosphatase [Atopobiaceae bacterium]